MGCAPSTRAVVTPKEAIQVAHETESRLRRRVEYLERRHLECMRQARSYALSSRRYLALDALASAKRIDANARAVLRHIQTVADVRAAIESALDLLEVASGVKSAASAMGELGRRVRELNVDALLEEIQEQSRAVSDALELLSGEATSATGPSEAELEQELTDLLKEAALDASTSAPSKAQPAAPEPDLEALARSMGSPEEEREVEAPLLAVPRAVAPI